MAYCQARGDGRPSTKIPICLQAILAEMESGVNGLDFGAGTGTFAYAAMLAERGINVSCAEPDAAQSEVLAAKERSVGVGLD